MKAAAVILALCLALYWMRFHNPGQSVAFSLIHQKTSAGRSVGPPAILAAEGTFQKNDLLAIQVDCPKSGHLYAFQTEEDGTFEILYPLAPEAPALAGGKQIRLPVEPDQWIGFSTAIITLVWSPGPHPMLETLITGSEVEREGVRAIREPVEVSKLEKVLQAALTTTHREIATEGQPRSLLKSTSETVGYRFTLQVD